MTKTEIETAPSLVQPGKTNIVIVAATADAVQAEIFNLADEWPCVEFGYPVRTDDGRWAAMGRVWT